jgi:hypothetical protein
MSVIRKWEEAAMQRFFDNRFCKSRVVRVLACTVLAGLLLVSALAFTRQSAPTARADAGSNAVVGTWIAEIRVAPFSRHGFIFHEDGTLAVFSPDGVDTTSDSPGYGVWADAAPHQVKGAFREDNAPRGTKTLSSTLLVTFTIAVDGDAFSNVVITVRYLNPDGSLQSGPFTDTRPESLTGTRMTL